MTKTERITDEQLESSMIHWFEHYEKNGYRHISPVKWEKITELYFEEALERTLNDLPEMSEDDNDLIIERIQNLF